MNAQVIPDCTHIRRADAVVIAQAIEHTLRGTTLRLMFWLYPNGVGTFHVNPPAGVEIEFPHSLVGCYDASATVDKITADILAIQRETVHG